jgi:hypothetical protein
MLMRSSGFRNVQQGSIGELHLQGESSKMPRHQPTTGSSLFGGKSKAGVIQAAANTRAIICPCLSLSRGCSGLKMATLPVLLDQLEE